MDNFLKLYQSLGLQEHSDYLLELLQKQKHLKQTFIKKYQTEFENIRLQTKRFYDREKTIKKIELKAEELRLVLNDLDFEDTDWDSWTPTQEYVPDYEIAQILAEEEASQVFKPFYFDFEISLLQEDLTDIVSNFISIIHGVLCAEINDPFGNLCEMPNEFFICEMDDLIKKKLNTFKERTFVSSDYNNCFDLIFAFNQKHYNGRHEFLVTISNFMIQIITDIKIAEMAWNIIKLYNTPINLAPKLLSNISSLLANKSLWLECHEAIFLADYETSIKLLDYYYQENKEEFEIKALLLAEQFKNLATDYLIDKVKKGTDLHISLLKRKVSIGDSYRYFKELKTYLNKQELNQFIDSIQYANIKVEIYGKEGMYGELEELIRNELKLNYSLSCFDFINSVKYFYTENPDLALELTVLEINKRMSIEKNRKTYNYIAKLLKESKSIVRKLPEVNNLIEKLYNQHPSLPALKDEFKKANII